MEDVLTQTEENGKKPNEYQVEPGGYFKEGNPGGGRPTDTPEDKIVKKATKQLIQEYKEALAEALPLVRPALIKKALEGDVPAMKELHDRAMGKPITIIGGDEKHPLRIITVDKDLANIYAITPEPESHS